MIDVADRDEELERLRARLSEAEGLYAALTEQLPFSIYRKDREGRFVFGNRAFCLALGRSPGEIVGRTDFDFSPPELAEKYVADDRKVMESGETLAAVEQHLDRDGQPTYIQIFKHPIRNSRAEIVGTLGLWSDVTSIKRTENALAGRTAELERAMLSLETNQLKLLISEKMASLGRLTAGIAHEMNTPLAAVRSALAELQRLVDEYASSAADPGVTASDHLEIAADMGTRLRLARTAAERAVDFVRGIKAQTRGLGPVEKRRFDAVAIVRETLHLLHHALRLGNVRLDLQAQTEHVEIDGDAGRLAQVVTNLVSNAVDASQPGGGVVTVSLLRRGPHVVLQVADQGCGIPSQNLARIFDPMFTTKPFGEGTGLGLSIVHDLVKADLAGTIEVRSEIGKGTTFEVILPRPPGLSEEATDGETT